MWPYLYSATRSSDSQTMQTPIITVINCAVPALLCCVRRKEVCPTVSPGQIDKCLKDDPSLPVSACLWRADKARDAPHW